jgi:hypothetical protein
MQAAEVVDLKLSLEQVMAEVKMLRNIQTNTRNSHQTFRNMELSDPASQNP